MAFFELLLNRVSLEYSEVLNDELRDWGKALRIFFFFFSRLRLLIHTSSAARCAEGEAARWRQFSEVRDLWERMDSSYAKVSCCDKHNIKMIYVSALHTVSDKCLRR